jgi:uncharacterized protein (TIGR03437 family)
MPAGAIDTIAGTGEHGYSAPAAATAAQMEISYGVAVDAWGNVFIADTWNHRIRRVTPGGVMSVFAGTGTNGFGGDFRQAISAFLSFPRALAVDAWGRVYVSDSGNNRIRRIDRNGEIQTVAGTGIIGDQVDGGLATAATLRVPRGLAVDAAGNLYIADSFNARIRKVGTDGRISTIAGTGVFGNSGDGGPAREAEVGFVHSLAVDRDGTLYFTDSAHHCVRMVRTDGVIETVAGAGGAGFSGDDGDAYSAKLNQPRGLALAGERVLYVSDQGNHRIRRISVGGQITTVAGTGSAGFGGDQGPAGGAVLNRPYGLTSDARGNLYVADMLNYRVRKIRLEALGERPALTREGVVNAANFQQPLSPGGLFSVFGSNFGYGQTATAAAPLPVSLAGTSVMVNGSAVPMVLASSSQINAQLPWGLPAAAARVKVGFGGVESDEVMVPVAAAAPGLFIHSGNRAVAQNQDFSLNSPGNAAARGASITLYATGLGTVTSGQTTGAGAPSNPLARTVATTTVLIGTVSARILFSGLAPGFVGLWQINAEVPANAPVGAAVPVRVSVSGTQSNEGMISVR